MTYRIIQYENYPNSGPEKRVAILFDGETVKVWLSDGSTDVHPIIIPTDTGIEIIGAISEINRIGNFIDHIGVQ